MSNPWRPIAAAALSLGLLLAGVATDTAAASQAASACGFNGRLSSPVIYNDGGVQGTIKIKRGDGSQISIGSGASAPVCPAQVYVQYDKKIYVRCSNGNAYWIYSGPLGGWRAAGALCSYSGGSSNAHFHSYYD